MSATAIFLIAIAVLGLTFMYFVTPLEDMNAFEDKVLLFIFGNKQYKIE